MHMYKRFLLAAFVLLSLVVSPLMSLSAQALSPLSNALIKIDGSPTVYWLATDNKRYVFPNPRTFYSWFTADELSRVVTLSPQQMGAITLGGNVTYRPGVRLVKVTTDPRVYAVSRYGVLRWITSEALAQQLYGQNWAQQVDDVPDEFFFNYRVGDPVYASSQFNVQFELGQARSPSDNISNNGTWPNPPADPTSAISGQILLSLNNANPSVGESIAFTARLANSTNSASDITLSIFSITGETLLVCTNSLSCTHNWYMDSNLAGFGRTYYARVTHRNGQMRDSNTVTLQVRGTTATSGRPTMTVNNANPRIGDTVTLTATANDLNVQQGTLSIIGPTGSELQNCSNNYSCVYSFVMTETIANNMRTASQGSYTYYARFFYSNRNSVDSANVVRVYAPTTNTNVPGTSMVLTFDRTEARVGQLFNVVATIRPESSGAPYYTIRIYDQWNVLQHTCINVRVCTLQQVLSPTTDPNRTYYATATGDNSQQLSSGNQTIVVQPTTQESTTAHLGNSRLTLSVGSDATITLTPNLTVASGNELRLSASVQPALSSPAGLTIKFYDSLGNLLSSCSNYNTCGTTKVVTNNNGQDATLGFKARVEDAYGDWYETPVSNVIVRSTANNNAFSATLLPSINPTSVKSGETFFLNGEVKGYNSPTEKIGMSWYQDDGALITTCYGREVCSVGTSYYANNGTRTLKFYFEAWDTSGARTGTLRSDLQTVTIVP